MVNSDEERLRIIELLFNLKAFKLFEPFFRVKGERLLWITRYDLVHSSFSPKLFLIYVLRLVTQYYSDKVRFFSKSVLFK